MTSKQLEKSESSHKAGSQVQDAGLTGSQGTVYSEKWQQCVFKVGTGFHLMGR